MRYQTGETYYKQIDLASSTLGIDWGHTRGYNNVLNNAGTFSQGNGYNWLVSEWMYAADAGGGNIMIVLGANSALWFQPNGSGGYTPLYGARDSLSVNSSTGLITLTMPNGVQYVFNSITANTATAPRGSLVSVRSAGFATITTSYTSFQLTQVVRADASGTNQEIFDYVYFTSGANTGSLQQVTMSRSPDGGSTINNIRQVIYTYYDGVSETGNGSLGDLRTATVSLWDPVSSAWVQPLMSYYRYYVSGAANGFVHALKYAFTPDGMARIAAAGYTYSSATDTQVQPFSAIYLQYDSSHRVTYEVVNGVTGNSSVDQAYSYSFSPYPTAPSDFNSYAMLTTQGNPDGSVKLVYTNQIGAPIITELRSASSGAYQKWVEYRQYDSAGRLTLQATPAAVQSYSLSGNTFSVTFNSAGLIYLSDYYPDTASVAPGYPKGKSLQNGSSGTVVRTLDYTYTTLTLANGTSFVLASETVYKTESSSGAGPITTSYSWTPESSPPGLLRTTTLPDTSSQNGTTAQVLEFYDLLSNLVWRKDERGRFTNWSYDQTNNVVVEMIRDVDPSQVPPPSFMSPGTITSPLHLVTDYEYDDLGRLIQQLDPTVKDTSGANIRTATWTVYQDAAMQVWTTQGYVDSGGTPHVTSPAAPVSMTWMDNNGRVTDTIVAQRNSSATGQLSPLETYTDQTKWARWTHNKYNDSGQLIETWLYFSIPANSPPTINYGTSGTNYNATLYGYDNRGRQNRVQTPGGTITATVYDVRNLVTQVSIGTNDGIGTSNMQSVTVNEYDNGADQGNSLLTTVTHVIDGGANDRITHYIYDWRNRQQFINGENGFFQQNYYDNLDRVYQVDRNNGAGSGTGGTLVGRTATAYDDRNRVYQTTLYPVNISTGTVGTAVTAQTFHDAGGNVLQQTGYGIAAWTKQTYDGIGRVTRTYYGYGSGPPTGVTVDVVIEQTQPAYDAAGNVIGSYRWQRYDNELTSYTGVLGNTTTHPYAWLSFVANWYDQVNRPIATCNYGSNNFTRPNGPPSSSSTALVSTTTYNVRGEVSQNTDPSGMVSQQTFDDAGRLTQQLNNPQTGGTQFDQNQTVSYTYNPDGRIATLKAVNPTSGGGTGDQTTTYTYGVTLSGSGIASNDLLASVQYPASTQTVRFAYNRQGDVTQMTDENSTVHAYSYDLSGRLTADAVTLASGPSIDNAILRIERQYEIRGMLSGVTSYDSTTGGTVKNDVQLTYTDFGQLDTDYQEHAGQVNTGSSLNVHYSYAYPRRTEMKFPGGPGSTRQVLDYLYLTGTDDYLNRVSRLYDGAGTLLSQYSYLGAGMVVTVDYTVPQVKYNLATGSTSSTRYAGMDSFSRTATAYWQNYSAPADLVKINYTYDLVSNRTSRQDVVAAANGVHIDEAYSYDGLHRLEDLTRGTLSGGTISSPVFRQNWMNTALTATALDPTGNWTHFRQDNSNGGSSWSLDQTRTHNQANEITGISGGGWPTPPSYDAVGNTTSFPQPLAPTSSYTAVYDAWNRLVKLSASSTTVVTYAYDGLNRRISKTPYSGGVAGDTRHFYYSDSWQVVEERISPHPTIPERQFFWGIRYVDDLVLRDRDVNLDGAMDDRQYCMQDANWNVMAICDTSAGIYDRMRYDAYGVLTLMSASFATPFGPDLKQWETFYAGYRWDSESGLYQVRNRYLHALLGRWVQRDPAKSSRTNLYEYVNGIPINALDPQGLEKVDPRKGLPDEPCTVTIVIGHTGFTIPVVDGLIKKYKKNERDKSDERCLKRLGVVCCQSENRISDIPDPLQIHDFPSSDKPITKAQGFQDLVTGIDLAVKEVSYLNWCCPGNCDTVTFRIICQPEAAQFVQQNGGGQQIAVLGIALSDVCGNVLVDTPVYQQQTAADVPPKPLNSPWYVGIFNVPCAKIPKVTPKEYYPTR